MEQADLSALLAIMAGSATPNVSARRVLEATSHYAITIVDLLLQDPKDLIRDYPGNGHALVADLRHWDASADSTLGRELERLDDLGVQTICMGSAEYPQAFLTHLGSAVPAVIFCLGEASLLSGEAAGVVGARDVSERGKALARECARYFAGNGNTVVSGGARGVDLVAHITALHSGGSTVVILPQGLLSYKPPAEFVEAYGEGKLLLVSPYLPRQGWHRAGAIARNPLISALSRVVCVIEPKRVGGSVKTARAALEQGKRVLIYTAPTHSGIGRELVEGGAESLLDDSGQFDPRRLSDRTNFTTDTPHQGRLFS